MSARGSDAVGWHSYGVLIASGLLLGGCGTTRYARTPQPAADLSGHWMLDAAASDDAAKMIAAIVPHPKPRPAPSTDSTSLPPGQGGGSRGGGSGDGSGRGGRRGGRSNDQSNAAAAPTSDQVPSWGKVRPSDFITAFAMPPPRLEIEQQPAKVSIAAEDARRRDFEPGDEQPFSVTDRYGSRKVNAGWLRDQFLVHSQDGSRLNVVEHFQRSADDHVDLTVEFSAQGLKSLTVHSRYRRATEQERATPSADGPPAPAPR